MKTILGLDLGTNSIGWALVKQDFEKKQGEILGMGSRIIPMGVEKQDYEKGIGITKNATRREKRMARRGNKRYKLRRNKLLFILNELGMLPEQFQFKGEIPQATKIQKLELLPVGKKTQQLNSLSQCKLSVKALTEKVELKEFGKILYKFNQLRGYSGGNNENNTKNEKNKEDENQDDTKKKNYEIITEKVEILNVKKSEETFIVAGGKNKGETQNYYIVTIKLDDEDKEGKTKLQNLAEKVGEEEELKIIIKRNKNGEETSITIGLPEKSDWRKAMEANEKILKEGDGEKKGIKDKGYYISELQLMDLQQNKWTKIRNRVFLRSRYQEEFDKIWETQEKFYSILKDYPKETIEKIAKYLFPGKSKTQQELRKKAIEGGLKYIIRNQIIYYQRPPKPQTELISNCRFEKDEKNIAISHPLFQEFRCWKQINNLYVTSKILVENKYEYQNRYLTNKEKTVLYQKLQIQKEVSFSAVIDVLNLNKSKIEKLDKKQTDYFLNGLNPKAKLKGCDTKISIKKILGEHFETLFSKESNIIERIWDVIFDVSNHEGSEYETTSKRVSSIIELLQCYIDKETAEKLALNLAQKIKFPRKYANLSAKAIKNILPLMQLNPTNISNDIKNKLKGIKNLIETGEITDNVQYNLEDYIIEYVKNNPNLLDNGGLMEYLAISLVYGKHTAESIKPQIKNYHDIKEDKERAKNLRNPVVIQLANEIMQIFKSIWKQYNINPKELEIRVELARDLKNSTAERNKIWKGQQKNKKINDKIKDRLAELNQEYSTRNVELYKIWSSQNIKEYPKQSEEPTQEDIRKLKIWEEQKCISPYTLKPIPLSKLFSPDRLYDIDHVIPKSRYYDDSTSNKVVCETNINEEKGNRTAWEYISQQNSQNGICSVKNYIKHINSTFYGKKKKNLLAEKIPENPVNRQLKDTQYISVAIKNELAKIVGSDNVKTSTGEVTDFLRSRWGLRKMFMELTESRFKQMELWDLDENGEPKNKWVTKKVDKTTNKNIYEIKNWSKRYDHRHHAIDALVVALTTQSHIQRLNNLNKYYQDELFNRKKEFSINIEKKEKTFEAFFNLDPERRKEILEKIESSRYFEIPFNNLVTQVKKHLETMIVSQKPKDKLGVKADDFDKHTPNKALKKQIKIRGALHQETYYGKTKDPQTRLLRDTKTISISEIKANDISQVIDKVLQQEIKSHKDKYKTIKEAFTGEGLIDFNESRFQRKNRTKLKPPVYKVKIWYNKKEKNESRLQRLYDDNNKKSVITGDNYLFLVMQKGNDRVFDVASLYDSVAIAKESLDDNTVNFKNTIAEAYRSSYGERNKVKENPNKVLFYLQQNDLVYLPKDVDDIIQNCSKSKFEEWIKNNENKKEFCKRIYKVVKFAGNDCHFIPNNYANHINVVENDLKLFEFGSYKNCSPYEHNADFVTRLTQNRQLEVKKIQDSCIKIKIDWLGNISIC